MIHDALERPLRNLRLSVTDRCNLRCSYCMPEEDYAWLPRPDLLTFEEIGVLVDVFVALGVDRVRITGGEPLLRRDLDQLVTALAEREGVRDLALTTNGVLLGEQADALAAAGLGRITVSLDTLRPDRFQAMTRRDDLPRVLDGLAAARRHWQGIKLDTVVMAGTNDDEIDDLLDFAREHGDELRFIEYMDVGGATRWSMDQVLTRAELLRRIEARHGPVTAHARNDSAPADRFELADGTVFGIISSTTQPFCASCDRSRLTADGRWFRCLYGRDGLDLREPLRAGAAAEEIAGIITESWRVRDDRGAELRLAEEDRRALADRSSLRDDPHLEMHTRGG